MTHWIRRLSAAGLVALLLLIALLGKYGRFFTSRSDRQDSISSDQSRGGVPKREFGNEVQRPLVTSTIAPGIHVLNNLGPAAAYAVETSDGLVLVDSGLEATGATIERDFRYRHLDLARLRAILLTHAHADHSQGAQE